MMTITHDIELLARVPEAEFEQWVRDHDYPACADLPSVVTFLVARQGPGRYRETIVVRSQEEFAADMDGPTFARLERRFGELAAVVGEHVADVVGDGYGTATGRAD